MRVLAAAFFVSLMLPAWAQTAQPPSGTVNPARPSYVGDALLRAPLGPLPAGDALLAYTRDLLAPMLGAGASLTPFGASGTAYQAQAPGVPQLTMRWYEGASAGFGRSTIGTFERDLNGGCVNRMVAQRGGKGARVIAYATTCPTMDPPYHLWWLEASDSERSRLLLLATPSRDGGALLAGAERVLGALGMGSAPAGAPAASPAPSAPAPTAQAAPRPASSSAAVRSADLAEGYLRLYNGDQQIQFARVSPTVVRTVAPPNSTISIQEVEASSCARVVHRQFAIGSPGPLREERTVSLDLQRDLLAWEGANIRVRAGVYGELVRMEQGRPASRQPIEGRPALIQPGQSLHAIYAAWLGVIERFCPGPAAPGQQAASPGPEQAAPASLPSEVHTTRGLVRDKPFALSYPTDLSERNDGRSDLSISDAEQAFEVTLSISAATPSLSADLDARAFDGASFIRMVRGSVPGATLVGNALLRLPAGPAHLVHWSAPARGTEPASRYIDLSLYENGRQYRLSFAVRESAFKRRRETIGFILANFALSPAPRPCCADPVALPW